MAANTDDFADLSKSDFRRHVARSFTPRKTQIETSPRLASKLVVDHADTYHTAGPGGKKATKERSIQAMAKKQTRKRK